MRSLTARALVLLVTATPLTALAQPPAASEPEACSCAAELAGELRQIRGLLSELIASDREDLELRRLSTAVLYLQLRTRRIDALEDRIDSLRNEQRDIADQVEMYERNRKMFETHIAELSESDPAEADQVRTQLDAEIDAAADRLDDVERRILDLENQVAAARRDLAGLESYVNEGLGL